MKISVLCENESRDPRFLAEHGLSLHIALEDQNILFDMGRTGAFRDNARCMGIDLTQVDLAVLSHGHNDHSGGMGAFLQINQQAKVYLSEHAFGKYYNAQGTYLGLDSQLAENSRLVSVGDKLALNEKLTLFSCNDRAKKHPAPTYGLFQEVGGQRLPDAFCHEQYLLIRDRGKKVLISGCSHKGILNILDWFCPDVLVGGFHFMKLDPEEAEDRKVLDQAAKEMLSSGTVFYTGHCTGNAPFAYLKETMGDALHRFYAGDIIVL